MPIDSRHPVPRFPIGIALLRSMRAGYGWSGLRADVQAGLVVGVVAVPLSMALGIASGVSPQNGLFTAIIAGLIVGVLGGSRTQVSGPTAAFVVILAPIAAKYGLGGLMVATLMAGLLQLAMGAFKFGRYIQLVPSPVTAGFTAGIGLVIASLQVQDVLGLQFDHKPEGFVDRLILLAGNLPGVDPWELGLAATTMAILLLWPRFIKSVPAPLVGLPVAALLAWWAERSWGLDLTTIRDRFQYVVDGVTMQGIPRAAPSLHLPWTQAGPDGVAIGLSRELLRDLMGPAVAIALLGSIESLLSAVVADGLSGDSHDPDAELMAQGVGNIVSPFFGGIAATGALARTATNIRAGARSPVASVVHGVVVLLAMIGLAPLLGYLPMAALAALLLIVAWNMSEARHFVSSLRRSPRSDAFVAVTCFALTVAFDMVVAVTAGMALAGVLFIRRMVEVSGFDALAVDPTQAEPVPLPRGLLLYEVHGALFFGAAYKAVTTLSRVDKSVRVIVLDVHAVPAIDATALVNLRATFEKLGQGGVRVLVAGLRAQPAKALAQTSWVAAQANLELCATVPEAIGRGKEIVAGRGGGQPAGEEGARGA